MDYKGVREYDHRSQAKIGVLLVNLGTPDGPDTASVRRYLRQFLSDPRLIEVSRLKWWFVLNLFIMPFRPKASAKLYQKIWTKDGSPLLFHSLAQKEALAQRLEQLAPGVFEVELGMRIGRPGLAAAMDSLRKKNAQRFLILPLFPQYSGTTTGSVYDGVGEVLREWRFMPDLRIVNSYHDNPKYIAALTNSIRESFKENGKPQKLIFSFHGIPKRYFQNGDPYFCFCQKTARLIVEELGLAKEDYLTTFQSLFGKEEWLRPYTDETLQSLPAKGITNVQVVCPGFSVDCLETVEEIEELNREFFMHAGGKQYHYIPALNARPDSIEMLADLVRVNTGGWLPAPRETQLAETEVRLARVEEVKVAGW